MSEVEVKNELNKQGLSWEEFLEWMIGQTLSCDEKGNTVYYTHDVKEFIRMKKTGKVNPDFD